MFLEKFPAGPGEGQQKGQKAQGGLEGLGGSPSSYSRVSGSSSPSLGLPLDPPDPLTWDHRDAYDPYDSFKGLPAWSSPGLLDSLKLP